MFHSNPAITPRRLRRFVQFSLRNGLILITCFGFLLGFKVNRLRQQREAVKTIQAVDGCVTYDYQLDQNGKHIQAPKPPGPRWLRWILGDDFFTNVVGVSINHATDEKLATVARHLERLPRLTTINATNSQITDEGVQSLGKLTQGNELWLGGNHQLTGKSLSYLGGLAKLRLLELSDAQVEDSDLRFIGTLSRIETLELSFTQVTDKGLSHLARLPNLKMLGLCKNAITDVGLKTIEVHERLQILDLGGTQVSDSGISSLTTFKCMKSISLRQTHVTQLGFRRIREAMPTAKIKYP